MTSFNHEVAEKLREISALLAEQHANPFRSRAYINAAFSVENLPHDIDKVVQEKGIKGLVALPAIGVGIARSIYEYVATGHMTRLENLRGASDPVALFQTIPTVGRVLAQRIHDTLHVDTLESLENAARHGQLDKVEGMGKKRRQAIQVWLLRHLGEHRYQLRAAQHATHNPNIGLLLKVDADYREKAAAGKLPFITPKRYNPDNKAWLPILHATHGDWHFTAVYSNTDLAHQLDRVFDWVVIYFYDEHHQEGQHTVVTETRGSLLGRRVVRGRENECRSHYELGNGSS